MRISAALEQSYEFACRSAACRPPTSGGTGGSSGGSIKPTTARIRPDFNKTNVIKATPSGSSAGGGSRSKWDVMRDAQKRAGVPRAKRKSKAKPVKRLTDADLDRPNDYVARMAKAAAVLAKRKATNSLD
jgi:hypothetical protein